MGLFDKLKDKVSEATGIDVDSTLEAAGSAVDGSESLMEAAESFNDTKEKLTGI
jgi:hypothetical protein